MQDQARKMHCVVTDAEEPKKYAHENIQVYMAAVKRIDLKRLGKPRRKSLGRNFMDLLFKKSLQRGEFLIGTVGIIKPGTGSVKY